MKKRRTNWALAAAAGVGLAFAARDIARRKARLDFRTKSVVITGARGLALAIARQLAQEGARLALLARDLQELENAEQDLRGLDAEVMVLSCDVGDQAQVEQALALVLRRYARIDVLINIAGIIQVGPLENMRLQDYQEAMAIHFWGPLYSMNAVIPIMRQQGGGRIVNVASIGGVVAVPHLAPYVASKFALVGLSDVYRAELAKDNIPVTTVIPGLMRTGSHVNALFKGRNRQEYAWFSILNAQFFTSIDARKAAVQIIEACRYGVSQKTITLQARLLDLANTLFPELMADVMKITARFLPGPDGPDGYHAKTGWESQSRLSPSPLTVLSDRVVGQNNEMVAGDQ